MSEQLREFALMAQQQCNALIDTIQGIKSLPQAQQGSVLQSTFVKLEQLRKQLQEGTLQFANLCDQRAVAALRSAGETSPPVIDNDIGLRLHCVLLLLNDRCWRLRCVTAQQVTPNGLTPLTEESVKCGMCGAVVLEPIILPCGHPACRLCYHVAIQNAGTMCVKQWCTLTRTQLLQAHVVRAQTQSALLHGSLWHFVQQHFAAEVLRRRSLRMALLDMSNLGTLVSSPIPMPADAPNNPTDLTGDQNPHLPTQVAQPANTAQMRLRQPVRVSSKPSKLTKKGTPSQAGRVARCSMACQRCHSAKVQCSGRIPGDDTPCKRCADRGLPCVSRPHRKKGRPTTKSD
ncbi:MAG: hypothetical protein MHM6MM_002818 [Cercozoa sp. M6MM]